MFDLGASELLLIAIVAILVIGPKDMPAALRTAGRWIGKIRRLSSHFRSGVDAMIREAEMEEMEKKWKAQNDKIMAQNPASLPVESEPTGALPPRPPSVETPEAIAPPPPPKAAVEQPPAAAEARAPRESSAAEAEREPADERIPAAPPADQGR